MRKKKGQIRAMGASTNNGVRVEPLHYIDDKVYKDGIFINDTLIMFETNEEFIWGHYRWDFCVVERKGADADALSIGTYGTKRTKDQKYQQSQMFLTMGSHKPQAVKIINPEE